MKSALVLLLLQGQARGKGGSLLSEKVSVSHQIFDSELVVAAGPVNLPFQCTVYCESVAALPPPAESCPR